MNTFKLAAAAAALAFGVSAHAVPLNTIATGHVAANQLLTIEFSVDALLANYGTISAKLKLDSTNTFVAPSVFEIYDSANALISGPGNLVSTPFAKGYKFLNLAVGDYTIKFSNPGAGTYTVASPYSTTLTGTPTSVPEPESLALALAGLGMAGLLLKRRNVG